MRVFYHLIVFYFSLHLLWFLLRQKKIWNQLAAAMVLVLFLLRLFWVK